MLSTKKNYIYKNLCALSESKLKFLFYQTDLKSRNKKLKKLKEKYLYSSILDSNLTSKIEQETHCVNEIINFRDLIVDILGRNPLPTQNIFIKNSIIESIIPIMGENYSKNIYIVRKSLDLPKTTQFFGLQSGRRNGKTSIMNSFTSACYVKCPEISIMYISPGDFLGESFMEQVKLGIDPYKQELSNQGYECIKNSTKSFVYKNHTTKKVKSIIRLTSDIKFMDVRKKYKNIKYIYFNKSKFYSFLITRILFLSDVIMV